MADRVYRDGETICTPLDPPWFTGLPFPYWDTAPALTDSCRRSDGRCDGTCDGAAARRLLGKGGE